MDNGNAPAGNDGDHNNGIYQFNQSSNHYKTPKIYDFPIFAVVHSKSQNSILNRVIEMLSALLLFCRESNGDRWITITKGQRCRNIISFVWSQEIFC